MTANIDQKSLGHSTGTVFAYVARVKNGVWWEETGSNVRALPDDGYRRRSRDEARRERGLIDMWSGDSLGDSDTNGAACIGPTP